MSYFRNTSRHGAGQYSEAPSTKQAETTRKYQKQELATINSLF